MAPASLHPHHIDRSMHECVHRSRLAFEIQFLPGYQSWIGHTQGIASVCAVLLHGAYVSGHPDY